nr:MAG TPA: hypothetical protein [Caudoviricetes sp.]
MFSSLKTLQKRYETTSCRLSLSFLLGFAKTTL